MPSLLARAILLFLASRAIAAPITLRTTDFGEPARVNLVFCRCAWPGPDKVSAAAGESQPGGVFHHEGVLSESTPAGLPPLSLGPPSPLAISSLLEFLHRGLARSRC